MDADELQSISEGMQNNNSDDITIEPYRISLNFTGAHADRHVIEEITEALIEDAEKRGLFFEFGNILEMERDQIVPDSPLDKVLKGK